MLQFHTVSHTFTHVEQVELDDSWVIVQTALSHEAISELSVNVKVDCWSEVYQIVSNVVFQERVGAVLSTPSIVNQLLATTQGLSDQNSSIVFTLHI